jgi:hypothetical protein
LHLTAMPQVMPTVTACGMCLISESHRSRPISLDIIPDSRTAIRSPFTSNLTSVAADLLVDFELTQRDSTRGATG